MLRALLLLVLLFTASRASCQIVKGTVTDGETKYPLLNVTVTDAATGLSGASGTHGHFLLHTQPGNKLSFSLQGYRTATYLATIGDTMRIELFPISVKLPEYTIHQLTQYQKDSTEMAERYKKEIDQRPTVPKMSLSNGIAVSGLVTAFAEKFNKRAKENKRFRAAYQTGAEQKFIDTRYRPELVTNLTGLRGEPLIQFMNTHPMDYPFARAASDLEIKAWIRDCYKEYLKSRH